MIKLTVTILEREPRRTRISLITHKDQATAKERQAMHVLYAFTLSLARKVAADFKASVVNYG